MFVIDLTSIYTNESSSKFRMEITKNSFIHPPQIRLIPFNSHFIQCYSKDNQLISSSDLIEFQWNKQLKSDATISLTIELTKHFHLSDSKKANSSKRRRRNSSRMKIISTDDNSSLSPSSMINEEKVDQHLSKKIPLKWNLNSFDNLNASIVVLTYKNHKWKNSNQIIQIIPTENKNIYSITFVNLFLKKNFFFQKIFFRRIYSIE